MDCLAHVPILDRLPPANDVRAFLVFKDMSFSLWANISNLFDILSAYMITFFHHLESRVRGLPLHVLFVIFHDLV